MVNKKKCVSTIIFFLFIINLLTFVTVGQDNVEIIDLSILVPNSQPRFQNDKPNWIRGIWNYVNITTIGETSDISIVFYYGDTPMNPNNRNETNYYEWEYDHGSWRDVQHTSNYLQEENCSYRTEFFSFFIGIDQYANLGDWTLEIFSDNDRLLIQQIFVDNAITSLTLKTIPVTFNVVPFSENDYHSEEKFTVENDGNVPLKLHIDYGTYDSLFSTLDFNELIKPDQTARYHILLHSRSSWGPGTLTFEAGDVSVIGEIIYLIPPKKIVSLIQSNVSIGLPINLYIGHSGYELEYLTEGVSFQYVRNIEIYYNEIREVFAYITGNGEIKVDISSENLIILDIFGDEEGVTTPFTIRSTNTSEYPISVRVKGILPNTTGYIHYDLDVEGEIKRYTTQIDIGSPKSLDYDLWNTTQIITVIIIGVILILIIYMIYAQIKHKKK
jgi:hypothetical protein